MDAFDNMHLHLAALKSPRAYYRKSQLSMLQDRTSPRGLDSQRVFPLACDAEIHYARRWPVSEQNTVVRPLGRDVYFWRAIRIVSPPLNSSACRCLPRRHEKCHQEIGYFIRSNVLTI